MKKLTIIFSLLFATFALFAQSNRSINANFEVDKEGWTGHFLGIFETRDTIIDWEGRELLSSKINHEPSITWSNLIPPLNERGGISFSGKNYSNDRRRISTPGRSYDAGLFLFIQKEVTDLLPNTTYRVVFNMNWFYQMDPSALPITIKVGAMNQEPIVTAQHVELATNKVYEIREVLMHDSPTPIDRGEIGRNGHDFVVAGQLIPNESGLPFQQNLHNFENAFFVDTDKKGRLFLMIGVEPTRGDVENVFLNTLRVVMTENRSVALNTSSDNEKINELDDEEDDDDEQSEN